MLNFKIVSIEGNIGSGKSTFLSKLKEQFKNNPYVIFLKEPVDEWAKIKDENNVTILEKFYADQEKYSFSFQMMAYVSRLKILKDTINNIKTVQSNENKSFIIITERCLYTDKFVFAKMLYESGKIENVNYQIYLNWFDLFSNDFQINKIIYIKTNPNICSTRIKIRHRTGENSIPIDYLETCDTYHNNMLEAMNNTSLCKEQLILNGDEDIYKNQSILKEWITKVEKFIYN